MEQPLLMLLTSLMSLMVLRPTPMLHPEDSRHRSQGVRSLERVQMNRATAATLAVVILLLSGTGPLLAQGPGPQGPGLNDSPSRQRVLELLRQMEGPGLVPLSSPRGPTVAGPDSRSLQGGVPHPRTGPPRRGGDATMIVFYSLFLGGIALAIDGLTDDPNSKRKVLGGLALVGGAFAVSCATGAC